MAYYAAVVDTIRVRECEMARLTRLAAVLAAMTLAGTLSACGSGSSSNDSSPVAPRTVCGSTTYAGAEWDGQTFPALRPYGGDAGRFDWNVKADAAGVWVVLEGGPGTVLTKAAGSDDQGQFVYYPVVNGIAKIPTFQRQQVDDQPAITNSWWFGCGEPIPATSPSPSPG